MLHLDLLSSKLNIIMQHVSSQSSFLAFYLYTWLQLQCFHTSTRRPPSWYFPFASIKAKRDTTMRIRHFLDLKRLLMLRSRSPQEPVTSLYTAKCLESFSITFLYPNIVTFHHTIMVSLSCYLSMKLRPTSRSTPSFDVLACY